MARTVSARRSPAVARPRVGRPVAPPPCPRDVYLSVIARVGQALAYAADDGGGLSADACAPLVVEMRALYRSLRACRVLLPADLPPPPPAAPAPVPAASSPSPGRRPFGRRVVPAGG